MRALVPVLLLTSYAAYGIADDASLGVTKQHPVALLLALPDGDAGIVALSEWVAIVKADAGDELPPVWIPFYGNTRTAQALVQDVPGFRPFVVEDSYSWAHVMESFRDMNPDAAVFGFIGEGILPPPDLFRSVQHVMKALAGSGPTPTAVLTRSKSRGDDVTPQEWLPDTFIAQLWMNRECVTDAVFANDSVGDATLLDVLPQFLRAHRDSVGTDIEFVDGTSVLTSIVDVSARADLELSVENKAAPDGGDLYFGRLPLAIIPGPDNGDGDRGLEQATIGPAPWPPEYVLEAAANSDGLVIVNSVNCGYLDFASNFLQSVQSVSDKKVLWVTTDDVAFDFMDNVAPGCAAALFSETSELPHATKAGNFGDPTFASQANIRPAILLHILDQGYPVLWTDSDMVWISDPSPVLPDIKDPEAVDLMVQWDGARGHPCTCLLFMKPTDPVKELVRRWAQNIVDTHAAQDQVAFQGPYHDAIAGIPFDVFPEPNFPPGQFLEGRTHEQNFARIHSGEIVIFHNNFIIGHDKKVERFKEYGLWGEENGVFPTC